MLDTTKPADQKEQEKLLRQWQWADTRLREDARRAIARGLIWESLLLRLIWENVVDAESLYRGMTVPPGDSLLTVQVGDCFEMLPSSFSRDEKIAATYFRNAWAEQGNIPLFMLLKNQWNSEQFGPLHAFDLANFLERRDHRSHRHQEIITAGKFRLLERRPLHEGELLILQQVGVYGIPPLTGGTSTAV